MKERRGGRGRRGTQEVRQPRLKHLTDGTVLTSVISGLLQLPEALKAFNGFTKALMGIPRYSVSCLIFTSLLFQPPSG